jgi:5-(carboxyamino)imidazole ribonucleotide mutase
MVEQNPLVSIVMGSKSDWTIMQEASLILDKFSIPHQARALSAHRTPDALFDYLKQAQQAGVAVIIAGAGCAAHLPGVIAAKTMLPVLGVPLPSSTFNNGLDALLSIVQMPAGIPVATFAVGKAGAVNAALFAISLLARSNPLYSEALTQYRQAQAQTVLDNSQLKG